MIDKDEIPMLEGEHVTVDYLDRKAIFFDHHPPRTSTVSSENISKRKKITYGVVSGWDQNGHVAKVKNEDGDEAAFWYYELSKDLSIPYFEQIYMHQSKEYDLCLCITQQDNVYYLQIINRLKDTHRTLCKIEVDDILSDEQKNTMKKDLSFIVPWDDIKGSISQSESHRALNNLKAFCTSDKYL